MQKVISIVLNNFKNDSRVLKECVSLKKAGYYIDVIALHDDGIMEKEQVAGINIHRVKLKSRSWSKKKFVQILKYFEFGYIVLKRFMDTNIIHCNDLNPLPIACIMRWLSRGRIKIVYDAHEFETERVGLNNPLIKLMMSLLERYLIKKVQAVITVSDGIAEQYKLRYKIQKPYVIMNCPYKQEVEKKDIFRKTFNISENQRIFLYQGGLCEGRGLELLIEAFKNYPRNDTVLVFLGYGPLEKFIKETADDCKNIYFHNAVPPNELLNYTTAADIGICYISNTCLSYYYCLPNKFFEYCMAGLPILANNLPEIKNIVQKYKCGEIIEREDVLSINETIDRIMDKDLGYYSENAYKVSKEYLWEIEEKKLIDIFCKLI